MFIHLVCHHNVGHTGYPRHSHIGLDGDTPFRRANFHHLRFDSIPIGRQIRPCFFAKFDKQLVIHRNVDLRVVVNPLKLGRAIARIGLGIGMIRFVTLLDLLETMCVHRVIAQHLNTIDGRPFPRPTAGNQVFKKNAHKRTFFLGRNFGRRNSLFE